MFNTQDDKGNISAYPLTWPAGWKRTLWHQVSASQFGRHSMTECTDKILNEVRLLGGRQCILSTNVRLRLDGLPYSNQRQPDDKGVAVYFTYKKKPIVFACDRWKTVEDNLWAIAKHIEALRGQERWGVGNLEQAFTGYVALPAPMQWWNVLGISPQATEDEIRAAYRQLAKVHHPDAGGSHEKFVTIQQAYERALQDK